MSKNHTKKKNKKVIKRIIVSVVILGLATGGTFGYMILKDRQESTSVAEGLQYQNYTVTSGILEKKVQESGTVSLSDAISVYVDNNIVIAEFLLEVEDDVAVGDPIALLDLDAMLKVVDDLKSQLSDIDTSLASANVTKSSASHTSSVEGRIKDLKIQDGDHVKTVMENYGYLCLISTDGKMKTVFESADATVTLGDALTLTLPDGEIIDAVLHSQKSDGSWVAVIDDDQYDVGTEVRIATESGTELAVGTLSVNAPVPVTLQSGIVDSVSVSENTYVYKRNTLFTLTEGQQNSNFLSLVDQREALWTDLQEALSQMEDPYIYSEVDGYISSLSNTDSLQSGAEICKVIPTDKFYMTISVDEYEISGIQKGQTATVTIDALDQMELSGLVTYVSRNGTSGSGSTAFSVKIEVDAVEGLLSGMSADCEVVIDSVENAIYVPVGAIQTINNKKYVMVAGSSGTGAVVESSENETRSTIVSPDQRDALIERFREEFPEGFEGNLPEGFEGNFPDGLGGNMPEGMEGFPVRGEGNRGNTGSGNGGVVTSTNTNSTDSVLVEVELGLVTDSYAQILSGVEEGDVVLIPIYSSSTNNGFSMISGMGGLGGMISMGGNGENRRISFPGGGAATGGQ